MESFIHKIFGLDSLLLKLAVLKRHDNKIVFTNGCFDLLHLGHVTYLEQAKALGTFLIVGVNSDASVRQLKGQNRPINNLENRMGVLAALSSVDAVISFSSETPLALIESIQPDVLVKGGDWDINDIVGADVVIDNHGQVLSLPLLEGVSTTIIEDKIIKGNYEK